MTAPIPGAHDDDDDDDKDYLPPMNEFPPPPPVAESGATQAQLPNAGLAIASLVCGIVGILFFGIILGPLAIIFALVALKRINRGERKGKGLAIGGLVCGIVATVAAVIIIAASV